MNKCVFIIFFCLISTVILADDEGQRKTISPTSQIKDPAALIGNELTMLDNLIEVTQQNLERQEALRELVKEYQKVHDQYMKNIDDKELLYGLIKKAYRLLENIKESHLEHAFAPEFISELTVFSQVAAKRGVPKP